MICSTTWLLDIELKFEKCHHCAPLRHDKGPTIVQSIANACGN